MFFLMKVSITTLKLHLNFMSSFVVRVFLKGLRKYNFSHVISFQESTSLLNLTETEYFELTNEEEYDNAKPSIR